MINRTHAFAVLSGGVVAATAVYACSSSSNPGTSPPVNEAGADVTSSGSGSSGSGSSSGSINEGGSDSPTGADGGPPPACTSLQNTVYIESGDTQEPLLKALGRKLRDNANITIVFELTGSCTLSPNLYNDDADPQEHEHALHPVDGREPDVDDLGSGADVHDGPEQRDVAEPRHLGALPEQLRRPRGWSARGNRGIHRPDPGLHVHRADRGVRDADVDLGGRGVLRVRRRREQPGHLQRQPEWNDPDAVLPPPGDQEHAGRDGAQHRPDASGDDARRRPTAARPTGDSSWRRRPRSSRASRLRRARRPSASSATRSTTRTAATDVNVLAFQAFGVSRRGVVPGLDDDELRQAEHPRRALHALVADRVHRAGRRQRRSDQPGREVHHRPRSRKPGRRRRRTASSTAGRRSTASATIVERGPHAELRDAGPARRGRRAAHAVHARRRPAPATSSARSRTRPRSRRAARRARRTRQCATGQLLQRLLRGPDRRT